MKTQQFPKRVLAMMLAGGLLTLASVATAQTAAGTVYTSAPTAAADPQVSYGLSEVVKLAQAKVDDGIIITYVKVPGPAILQLNAAHGLFT